MDNIATKTQHWKKSLAKLLLPIALSFFALSGALAHSFNVTLIIPLSGLDEAQGKQFLDGFMLATRERDAHPNEESDGHLGGLDVYVTTVDGSKDIDAQIELINAAASNPGSGADIVAYFTSEENSAIIQSNLNQNNMALLTPGENPFSDTLAPGTIAFSTSFDQVYGAAATVFAASGYNTARRIDQAIRAQGAVLDVAKLVEGFNQNATNFNW